jgi:hypothetical protein
MRIAVAVPPGRVPAWHGWCVAALRALPGAVVDVVRAAVPAWTAPPAAVARVAGAALAPAALSGASAAVGPAAGDGGLHGADLVVDLTGADVAADAPHGVWSLRLGVSDDRTAPFGREIAAGADTFEIALVRRRGAQRELLRAGRFGVTKWYGSTLRLALAEAAGWPATLAGALLRGETPPALGEDPAPARAPLTGLERVRFAAALAHRLGAAVADNFSEVVEWNVGFVEGGPRALLSGESLNVRWLPRPDPLTFIADPFVVERDGVRVLFVEQFDYDRNRGVIEALTLDERGGVVKRARAIDLPTHLSYPYPVEFGGELYLMPESCAALEVALYRCLRFPDVWERARAIFPDCDLVDTTVFEHDGRWWAFGTRWTRGANLALHAFHAETPFGPWSPHALNPIVVDVSCARPAGQPFVLDGALYRAGQDCTRSYGCGVALARVDELSPTAYRETVVRRLDARRFARYSDGIHTVSFSRDLVIVDGKHVYRDARKLGWAFRRFPERVLGLRARRAVSEPSPA